MCYFGGGASLNYNKSYWNLSEPSIPHGHHSLLPTRVILFLRLSPRFQWPIHLQRQGRRGAQFYHRYVLWFYSKFTLLVCQRKILVCLLPDTWSKIFSALHLFSRTISFSEYLKASEMPLVKFSWKLSVLQKWSYVLFNNEDTYFHV